MLVLQAGKYCGKQLMLMFFVQTKGNENNFICRFNYERKDYTQYNTGMAMPKLNKDDMQKNTCFMSYI